MTEFVRTLKKIYWRLFFVSTAVLIVEAILAPARFLTFFGLISFALLGVFGAPLCAHLARRHGVNVIDKEKRKYPSAAKTEITAPTSVNMKLELKTFNTVSAVTAVLIDAETRKPTT